MRFSGVEINFGGSRSLMGCQEKNFSQPAGPFFVYLLGSEPQRIR
jgi:hypothetical protein